MTGEPGVWEGWPEGEAGRKFGRAYDALFPPGRHRTWDLDHVIERWTAEPTGRVTDLGAGNGRSALLFAQAGFRVEAVEREPMFVSLLDEYLAGEWRHLRDHVSVVAGDITAYQPAQPIARAFANAFMNLSGRSRDRFFATLGRTLAPGGSVALLIMDLDESTLSAPSWSIPPLRCTKGQLHVALALEVSVDIATRTRQEQWVVRMEDGGAVEELRVIMRYAFERVARVEERAAAAGLKVTEVVQSPEQVPGRQDFVVWLRPEKGTGGVSS